MLLAGSLEVACGADPPSDPPASAPTTCLSTALGPLPSTWSPPKRVVGACTESQIQRIYSACTSTSILYNPSDCRTLELDPANAACLDCMYSIESDRSYGAVVFLTDGRMRVNVSGCIALLDGDAGASSCGAKDWDRRRCGDNACDSCPDSNQTACRVAAENGVCATYLQGADCAKRPELAPCTEQSEFMDYFRIVGAIFCAQMPDAGLPDEGMPDDGISGPFDSGAEGDVQDEGDP